MRWVERAVGPVSQPGPQLRLPDQHHRDQVAVVELEVGEQPDLLERGLAGDQVRLVHDEQRRTLLVVQLQEPLVDPIEELVGVEGRILHAELDGGGVEELAGRAGGG